MFVTRHDIERRIGPRHQCRIIVHAKTEQCSVEPLNRLVDGGLIDQALCHGVWQGIHLVAFAIPAIEVGSHLHRQGCCFGARINIVMRRIGRFASLMFRFVIIEVANRAAVGNHIAVELQFIA